ncbi:SMC family ATPase [Gemmata sp. G18]|uniref:SMC family ATPase n=1 Tax=Gemmata palustris TaxID=2822762 RepID=A0ABS5BWR7_9BACT|nr:SMC family ATPase [Gemmata palustris]MBP3957852.1 SMC family ATPase [Gemmata palustris]
MIPKRVTLENFLSYGPKTEIAFAADEPLWVVGGPNGVGKSAVFDAMTYCLYAEHRGGGRGHEQLIRHGADGFKAAFEFQFVGIDYRITRTRQRRGRTTQAVERLDGGCWARVPDVDGAEAVTEWVRSTLGLPFEAFCASVLLRQGRADDILDAAPARRLETLKKIIGVERYEELSGRVNEAGKERARELERLRRQRAGIEDVTQADLESEQEAVNRTAAARELADATRTRAVAAVPQAEQWARLTAEGADLTRKLAEADGRSRDEAAIRHDHARYVELSAVVPVLEELGRLRATVADAETRYTAATRRRDELRAKHDADRQRAEGLRLVVSDQRRAAADLSNEADVATKDSERLSGLLTIADELATADRGADAFPDTLDAELAAARVAKVSVAEAERTARDAEAEIAGLLKEAKKQQKAFADVTVGITCSQCGQEVTAKHAEDERNRLADRVAAHTAAATEAKAKSADATSDREAADARLKTLTDDIAERNHLRQRRSDLERSLTALGSATDPAAVREEIARLAERLTDLQAEHSAARGRQHEAERELKELDPVVKRQEGDLQRVETEATQLATALARDTAACDGLLARLPDGWRDSNDATAPAADLRRLAADGIEPRFRQLEADATLRREWEERQRKVVQEMGAVPADARIAVADARQAQRSAEQVFALCDTAHRDAVSRMDELTRRQEQLATLTTAAAAAETDARVHAKLDKLLGKEKLQRELIREAEAAIVRLTQQTLANLSGGDLSVRLADADGDDKAFDLLVFRGDDPNPIPVKMLSGSQKFRVAVSVALAVGRFATGQARPLECVIIDEGFGSLDRDGLRAAADELNRLKDHLRRIIVVSHQEEFTDQFPVVIRLSKGDAGTTAEAVRQQR